MFSLVQRGQAAVLQIHDNDVHAIHASCAHTLSCTFAMSAWVVTACPTGQPAVLQVDDNDVPITKLIIRDAEVLWNPFDDLQPRMDKEDKKAAMAEEEARLKQK